MPSFGFTSFHKLDVQSSTRYPIYNYVGYGFKFVTPSSQMSTVPCQQMLQSPDEVLGSLGIGRAATTGFYRSTRENAKECRSDCRSWCCQVVAHGVDEHPESAMK